MAETIGALLEASVRAFGDRPAVRHKHGEGWRHLTYAQLGAQVRQCAGGLAALGVKRGDTVALIAENRPEWVIADLAMLTLGAVNVPMFTSLPPAQIEYIVRDSGARWLIVSDRAQLAKALVVRERLPELTLLAMEEPPQSASGVLSFVELMRLGEEHPLTLTDLLAHREAVRPEDLASIVYTSGTTGEPKGVMLTHRNFMANVEGSCRALSFGPGDVVLSFLPLNHCLERVGGYYAPLAAGAEIVYAQNLRRFRENVREVEPTFIILVPRVYEAFQEAVRDRVAEAGSRTQRLFAWAVRAGETRVEAAQGHRRLPLLLALRAWLADRLLFARLRRTLGFRRRRFLISGGAPLSPDTALFFHAVGLPVLEGYGLTEASPVVAVNRVDHWKIGTVGPPLDNVEVAIAPGGEVLCRGDNVMVGYHNQPEATAEVLDAEGWLHTGDIGELDEEGFLRITDRLKDLLVLTNGKKVAPQHVEGVLTASPYLAQAVVLGEGRSTLAALLVPAFDRVRAWGEDQGLALPEDPSALVQCREVRDLMRAELDRLSTDLADYERVRGFALLDREFTVESGELTPTLKIRRRPVMAKHAQLIDSLYR